MPTLTYSAKTAVQVAPGLTMTPEDFQALLTSGTDEVFGRKFDSSLFPFEGGMIYDEDDMSKSTKTFQSVIGMGNVPRNRDDEDLPHDAQAQGFAHSVSPVTYRNAARWTQELVEDELYGQLSDNSEELANSSRRTVEHIMADGVNRATGTAPFLCEDGMYWFDESRPNPVTIGGTWGNIESAGAISASMLFAAGLSFTTQNNARGQRESLNLTDVYIRPNEEVETWELVKSDLRPTDSQNARNFQMGRFQYHTYNLMTTSQILFRASGKMNEVKQFWRVRPTIEDEANTPNNVFGVMVRFRYAIGALRPDMWRQATVS